MQELRMVNGRVEPVEDEWPDDAPPGLFVSLPEDPDDDTLAALADRIGEVVDGR